MASKAMWEVDPETRSKLLEIQKTNGNDRCCDCSAPSPQWASPKFGVFICLSCAGVHRGLGVHISFVRSVTMDAFKAVEIERMRLGGNERWRSFFDGKEENRMMGLTFDDATIAERYSSEIGEEWKERLSAKVEGREYVPGTKPLPAPSTTSNSHSQTPLSQSQRGRNESPSQAAGIPGAGTKAKVDDKYFASLGAANAGRSDDLPPSQGGKYAGFGSTPIERPALGDRVMPGLDDLKEDPLKALGKGFGWFASTVGKTAKSVNEGYIQPTARQVAESDFAKQASMTAAQVARNAQNVAQTGATRASEGLSRFVEGGDGYPRGGRNAPLDESKKDFWDSFADAGAQRQQQQSHSAVGTSAIKNSSAKGDEDGWDKW